MKINSILIANRGEIAVRIIKTAKKLGIKTFVIKTAKEPKAMYLEMADEVIDFSETTQEIPEFLDIERIINAAKEYKVEAVHPGYGFLAESPYFAQRCHQENIIYIGPSADAIYKMGNKTIAKQIAVKQDIPLIQGSNGDVGSFKRALVIARNIGYPVILKAASGGGGRGMRIVNDPKDMEKSFKLATSEAEKAFNDPSVFIEKYIRNPRHIEFQIIGDKHGNIVHLGERECSIQRKHQKLIEESPSPALTSKLRKTMGEAAIKIAQAVNYYSAGTVEFLLDSENKFYFMEMNTRIQVEHPVTEEVTGLDLIELMIRIAEGEKLPISQKDVKLKGWAIEYRINAEDVQAGFSPNLGIIQKFSYPAGKTTRIDTGVTDGSAITPYFDSMIAKLIATGSTREKAITNSLIALNKIKIQGLKTTIPFHKAVLNTKAFKEGDLSTSFIDNELEKLYFQEPGEEEMAAFIAAFDYLLEVQTEEETVVDYDKGKNLTPWLLNKRMKSL
ncbi:MAG: acetyl-CoA carboxylase biotin carboxylase subunit [Prolixibacteraceae bacterium]|nr:acetyl-CoA carboxylase biotin carboxylase subunit [Prolixibacteraceae bacterium]